MIQLLGRMLLELLGNRHVLGTLDRLRIHDIRDDRLILPGEVFVEKIDQLLASHQPLALRFVSHYGPPSSKAGLLQVSGLLLASLMEGVRSCPWKRWQTAWLDTVQGRTRWRSGEVVKSTGERQPKRLRR